MGTTADKLQYLNGTKTAIKNAIVAKGVAVPDGTTFRAYADKIADIQDVSSLPTQGAKTVTPTTTEQIAVASGRYTTGDVKVAGDANLVAENIAEGVSIFGVTGTLAGGGGATFQHGSTVSSAGGKYSQYSFSISLNGGENIIVYTYLDAPYVIGYVYNQNSVAVTNGDYTMSITSSASDVTISGACGSEFGITIDYYYIIF